MFSSPGRTGLVARFLASGAVNTAVGLGIIFLLMALGVSPVVSNVCGYAVGLAVSFTLNRRFVFYANGRIDGEFVRFIVAFGCSFLANLAVLRLLLALPINPVVAQVFAAATYTAVMFVLCNAFVFRQRRRTQ
jgi:putative flippase GtrA